MCRHTTFTRVPISNIVGNAGHAPSSGMTEVVGARGNVVLMRLRITVVRALPVSGRTTNVAGIFSVPGRLWGVAALVIVRRLLGMTAVG